MAEENVTGAKLIAELNDLIRLDHDAIGSYTGMEAVGRKASEVAQRIRG